MFIRVLRPEEVEELYKKNHAEEIARVEKERKERAYKGLVLEAMDYPPQWQERFFRIEKIGVLYGKNLLNFMNDCNKAWIEREISYDEYDKKEDEHEEDENEW